MKIKEFVPAETSTTTPTTEIETATIKASDLQTPRFVGFDELVYEKIIKLEEQMKLINKKLDELLGEEE